MRRSLGVAVACVIVVMSALAFVRWNIWSYGADTGTFAQIALNTFNGFTDGPEHGTHFRFHWSPILALLWPFVAATRSALSIQILQVVLISLAALPLAAIVRAYAGDVWGLRVGILALIYPPLLADAFSEFHELAFYPVIVLALFWAADRARWGWFAVFSIAAALIREDVCLELLVAGVALGIIGIVKRCSKQRGLLVGEPLEPHRLAVAGFALAALCAGVLVSYFWVIAPHAGGWQPTRFYQYPFANGPVQMVIAMFTHPAAVAASVLTLGRFTYLLEAFAPLAFLPLLTRWTWLAVPGFAVVLLSSDSIVWRMGFHYELLWAPWLLLAAAAALVQLTRRRDERTARAWWISATAICAIVLVAFNPMHPLHYLQRTWYGRPDRVAQAFGCVPKHTRLATHDEWFAHESLAYPDSTNITAAGWQTDGYIVYASDWHNAYVHEHLLPQLQAARLTRRYFVVCRAGDVVVMRPSRTAG
jgi:uncharacterized membrane protein